MLLLPLLLFCGGNVCVIFICGLIIIKVVVCQEKSTQDVFAMKIMHKSHILRQSDVSEGQVKQQETYWYGIFSEVCRQAQHSWASCIGFGFEVY